MDIFRILIIKFKNVYHLRTSGKKSEIFQRVVNGCKIMEAL